MSAAYHTIWGWRGPIVATLLGVKARLARSRMGTSLTSRKVRGTA
jgi:hypothetical protein